MVKFSSALLYRNCLIHPTANGKSEDEKTTKAARMKTNKVSRLKRHNCSQSHLSAAQSNQLLLWRQCQEQKPEQERSDEVFACWQKS